MRGIIKLNSGFFRVAIFLPALLMTGCALNKPPEYESASVAAVCAAKNGETVSVSHLDQTKLVTVHLSASWDELYAHCGESGGACVNLATNEIHMVDDRRCMQHASHELAHVFGIPGLDVGESIEKRRADFNRL